MINFNTTSLTDDEKKALKALKNHPWYEALKKVEQHQRMQLGDALIRLDLNDKQAVQFIQRAQYYAQWREDFLRAIELNTLQDISLDDIAGVSISTISQLANEN